MKDQTNKHIEHFVEKVMKSSSLEKPSFDFTARVMSQVTSTSSSNVTVYRPLISKTTWVVLILITVGVITYSMFSKDTMSLVWLDKLDFSKVSNVFSGIKISNTVMYSLLMFAIMLFIQVPMLKHYYNKRFEV